ncbi:flagellin N-terminal helical domain-containing protein [Rhizobium sp. SL86]|uniref:flagellin N-terminal helical domain-containing protein n=1 Tax=Rhizobium sp. SL86 TaxID=2995148 RepID=UPI002272C2F7|nr:flagellin [Rhizobium sp. SL86]MCY1668050.1 flagellin [Rhizobium sp. SL86]
MTSILTNAGAISALQSLRGVSSDMLDAQSATSTGMRIDAADDNAAYWSIATTMRSDNKTISVVVDSLNLSDANVGVAYEGMQSVIDVLDDLKSKIVAAKGEGVDRGKIQKEVTQLQEQILSIAQSASFNEVNWLNTDIDLSDPAQNRTDLIASFSREKNGVSVSTMSVEFAETSLFNTQGGGLLQADPSDPETNGQALLDIDVAANPDMLESYIAYVDVINERVIDSAATLGALQNRLTIQSTFAESLMDSIDSGVGNLVDADMNEVSTRLKALQTQEQLATQALSIANSANQNILQLLQ